MKKIPTMFLRNPDNLREILDEPHPDCAWVFAGEGVATRKYDGTCCMIKDGKLFKRRAIKKNTTAPPDFIEEELDETTGKRIGWVPVDPDDPTNKFHMEAFRQPAALKQNLTYELVGPKIQGNPERYEEHILVAHTYAGPYPEVPRGFTELRAWLSLRDVEGLVFHHEDGRMAKIKKSDFGLKRKENNHA